MDINLTNDQAKALEILKSGVNCFITGPAGCGKSFLIKCYKHWCDLNGYKIYLTSTTGVSAILIGGTTTHKWAGFGLGNGPVDVLVKKIKQYRSDKKWKAAYALVIDEVSMLTGELLNKMEQIARILRFSNKPFGGIQLILTGDFAQLPPVKATQFAFEHPIWNKIIDQTVYLQQNIRQIDPTFNKILTECRLGRPSKKSIEILQKQLIRTKQTSNSTSNSTDDQSTDQSTQSTIDNLIKPTRLFSTKVSVANINHRELNNLINSGNKCKKWSTRVKLISKRENYILSDKHKSYLTDWCMKNSPVGEEVKLANGAQVMLLYNLDVEDGLANGSRGVIIDVDGYKYPHLVRQPNSNTRNPNNPNINIIANQNSAINNDLGPLVRFASGREEVIPPVQWIVEDDDIECNIVNIPLMLAYATTIHKSQGSTLDCVEIDLGASIFEYGQAYVALSRVRTLEGLSLINLDPKKIRTHKKVRNYYNNLGERSSPSTP